MFRRNKYGNKPVARVCYYGYSHRSQLEAALCANNRLRELSGEIEHVGHEVHVYLTDARILYVADYEYKICNSGEKLFLEAKGFEAPRWPTIKKLWKFYGPGSLEIWKGSASRLFLDETIFGRGCNAPES